MRLKFVTTVFTVGIVAMLVSCPTDAGDKQEIDKIAAALRKGDFKEAKTLAAATAKNVEEFAAVMKLLKEQAKGDKRDGYLIAAVGELAIVLPPDIATNKSKKKAWVGWSEDLRKAGLDFTKAKGAPSQKKAAARIDAVCNSCHNVFK